LPFSIFSPLPIFDQVELCTCLSETACPEQATLQIKTKNLLRELRWLEEERPPDQFFQPETEASRAAKHGLRQKQGSTIRSRQKRFLASELSSIQP